MLSVGPAGVLGPQRSRGVRELDLDHQVQLRRQHLAAAQDAHHGGAQQHIRVAVLVHRAGDARVVRGHGAAIVVYVVAALAVGEDLDALDEAGGVGRSRGQRVGATWLKQKSGLPWVCFEFV